MVFSKGKTELKGKQIEYTHVSRSKTRSNEYKHIQFNRATEYDSAPGDIRINPGPNLWTDFPAKLIKKEKLLPTEKENLPPNFLLLCLLSVRSESERYLLSFIPLETLPYNCAHFFWLPHKQNPKLSSYNMLQVHWQNTVKTYEIKLNDRWESTKSLSLFRGIRHSYCHLHIWFC